MMRLLSGIRFCALTCKKITMNITLGKPLAVSDKGRRSNNEDALYPQSELVSPDDRVFLVCDGVGGAERGEVASALACDIFPSFFRTFLEGVPDAHFVQRAVQYVETCFDKYIAEHPDAMGMATTMTLLYVAPSSVLVAHIGDSRIYQFRKGKIVFRTEDHSLINSWLKLGRITPEEAASHPQRNIILRAIQGSQHPVEADVEILTDIEPGDVFLMCTDGVVESWPDKDLEDMFSGQSPLDNIKERIVDKCLKNSRDNFSFYLIPIDSIQKNGSFAQNVLTFLYSFV